MAGFRTDIGGGHRIYAQRGDSPSRRDSVEAIAVNPAVADLLVAGVNAAGRFNRFIEYHERLAAETAAESPETAALHSAIAQAGRDFKRADRYGWRAEP